MVDVTLTIVEDSALSLAVDESGTVLSMELSDPYMADPWPVYEGTYEVSPEAWADVELPTANRSMLHDLTVLRTPYQSTSNPYGGRTAIIGS